VARANADDAAWALAGDAPELPIAAAASRIAACEASWFAAKENIQTHGGIGFTRESSGGADFNRSGFNIRVDPSALPLVGSPARAGRACRRVLVDAISLSASKRGTVQCNPSRSDPLARPRSRA
jgi:alkylation response protein AidB-like acyl-CoA dehydrogenase